MCETTFFDLSTGQPRVGFNNKKKTITFSVPEHLANTATLGKQKIISNFFPMEIDDHSAAES